MYLPHAIQNDLSSGKLTLSEDVYQSNPIRHEKCVGAGSEEGSKAFPPAFLRQRAAIRAFSRDREHLAAAPARPSHQDGLPRAPSLPGAGRSTELAQPAGRPALSPPPSPAESRKQRPGSRHFRAGRSASQARRTAFAF